MAYLPGQSFKCTDNVQCEDCEKQAVWKVVGETDSFGSEFFYLCDEHMNQWEEEERNADHSGTCEWCKQHKPLLRPTRDIDEGYSGPVYNVCTECRTKQNEDAIEELEHLWSQEQDFDEFEHDDDDEEPEPVEYYICLLARLDDGIPFHYYLSIVKDSEGNPSYNWSRKCDGVPDSIYRWVELEDAEAELTKVKAAGGTFHTGEPWNRTIDINDVEVVVSSNYGAV